MTNGGIKPKRLNTTNIISKKPLRVATKVYRTLRTSNSLTNPLAILRVNRRCIRLSFDISIMNKLRSKNDF